MSQLSTKIQALRDQRDYAKQKYKANKLRLNSAEETCLNLERQLHRARCVETKHNELTQLMFVFKSKI